jgi:hypothetical protein
MTASDTWRPAVAGTFYPREPALLREMVDGFLSGVEEPPAPAIGAIAPHAGLVYSGQCAAHVLARIALPPVVVVLAPNHTGYGSAPGGASLWPRGEFLTPLGPVPVAAALAEALLARCDLTAADRIAHTGEHAIEVELPFLQALGGALEILPIVLAWDDWRRSEQLAAALAGLIAHWPQQVLLLASSDMTHYEPARRSRTGSRSRPSGRWTGRGCSRPAAASTSRCAGGRPRLSSSRRRAGWGPRRPPSWTIATAVR